MAQPVLSDETNISPLNGNISSEGLAARNKASIGITAVLQPIPPAIPKEPAPLTPVSDSAEALNIALTIAPFHPPESTCTQPPQSKQQSDENNHNLAIQAGEAQTNDAGPKDEEDNESGLRRHHPSPITPHVVFRGTLDAAPIYQRAGPALPAVGAEVDTNKYVIRPSQLEVSRGCIILRYSAAADRYERPFGNSQVNHSRKLC